MYRPFFGFSCKPFQLTPDPAFLFVSRVHRRALTYLNYGIQDNTGFILVTGEIGTGKTTVIRTLLKQIPQEITVARINNTRVTSNQLISMINEEFGLATRGKDKAEMIGDLTDFLIGTYAEGKRALIILDEAQNLSADLLEEVRLLSNLETDTSKLLQIVLVGQPELNATLGRPDLEQLRQRIAVSTHISALDREETEGYIRRRLAVAGNEDGVAFEDGVMDVIHEFSRGIPRLINIICEFMLLAAFSEGTSVITKQLIREVAEDLRVERPESKTSRQGEDRNQKIIKILQSISVRLTNLEAAVHGLQRGTPASASAMHTHGPAGTGDGLFADDISRKEEAFKAQEEYIKNIMEEEIQPHSSGKMEE